VKKQIIWVLLLFVYQLFGFDELWLKAQALYDNSWYYQYGQSLYEFDITMQKGKKTSSMGYYALIHHSLSDSCTVLSDLIYREEKFDLDLEDKDDVQKYLPGIDIDKMSKQFLANLLREKPLPEPEGFFLENDPKIISVKKLSGTRIINEHESVAFQFEHKPKNRKRWNIKGTVWLDFEKGYPILTQISYTNSIFFVKKHEIVYNYYFDELNNCFYPIKMIRTMQVIIPFNRKIDVKQETIFSDYFSVK